MQQTHDELIYDALGAWAPTWPRRVGIYQEWAGNEHSAVNILSEAERSSSNAPFISTYSFPRGHTKEGNVPDVDTLFIDFDIESGDYDRESGDRDAWFRDLSFLLVRVRKVAQYLLRQEAPGWRAALSGHKGVHLFLDFPTISHEVGTFEQFVDGVNEYATSLVDLLVDETDIRDLEKYIDVTSSDLGRLHRVPNTMHRGATESFGSSRYCVPVSIEELADITPDRYEELTADPRPSPYGEREPNESAGDIIEQHVATATPTSSHSSSGGEASYVDFSRYTEYVNEIQNDDIGFDDVQFLTADRPCIWKFYERDDKFDHGNQSHYMEMFCIREMQEKNVPVEVMHEFFEEDPNYDEKWTDRRIAEIISRDYNRFSVRRLIENAPEFCALDDCNVCQRALADMDSTYDRRSL